MGSYQIAFVSPEVVPFAKTGGLADVAGSLPGALARRGNAVKVFLPLYSSIDADKFGVRPIGTGLPLLVAGEKVQFDLYHYADDLTRVDYYFIRQDTYFDRDGLYVSAATGKDFEDNDERFIAFCQGVLESIKALGWRPNIIHCNDWQSALIPAYLRCSDYGNYFENVRTVFTIHNIGYQGLFPEATFERLGFEKKWYYPLSAFEYYGQVNFLKIGISFADILTTVSPRYAQEIQQSEEYGYGLEGVLRSRGSDLFGVLNGVDYSIWNPATDTLIKANYSPEELEGKYKNKLELRRQNKLPLVRRDVPIIGMISRLSRQKGFDLVGEIADEMFKLDLQMVILGSGDKEYIDLGMELARKYPKKLAVNFRFDNPLAHLIEAGADIFLMPSRYEPCGLNQMYSLKYGTMPIVRETGGLADTIENCNPARNTGTGFVFKNYDGAELLKTIKFALEVYKNKEAWTGLMKRGMAKDFSWDSSAAKYEEIYETALAKKPAHAQKS